MDREDYELQIEGIDAEAFSHDGEEEGKGNKEEAEMKEWLIDVCKTLSPIEEEEEGDGDGNEEVKSSKGRRSRVKKRKIDDVYDE